MATRLDDLRDTCGLPVSLIVAGEPPTIEVDAGVDAAAVLDRIVEANRAYRWARPRGRFVLYPSAEPWGATVSGIAIHGVPRVEAAAALVDQMREQVPALGDLTGVVTKGDPASPVFADPVTVSGDAPALEHLAALLGHDAELTFAIEPAANATRVLWFDDVASEGVR